MSESNQFLATLQRHRNGGLLAEASEGLQKVVAAVAQTGKPGKLTITLEIKPTKRGDTVFVGLLDDVKTKTPQAQKEGSWWFADESGLLTKNNPNQTEMKFEPAVHSGKPVEVEGQVSPTAAVANS